MNFHKLLTQRAADDNPVRVGLIGCGKFGTMFLTQALQTTGLHVVGIADLNIKRAQHNLSPLAGTAPASTRSLSIRHSSQARRTSATTLRHSLPMSAWTSLSRPPAFPVPGSNTAVVPSMPAITWSW
ncbi:MAG: hypothetical protein CM1200mP41_29510 [Gammaproteobacteria bacterium]|nr:MAG: hypothetical protein CM1200mP41_29510 [Gammaproteobacteria bacterium]